MSADPDARTLREERVREAVRALPRAAPDPEFLARLESDFVEGRLEHRQRFRKSRGRWIGFALPAAAAALIAIFLSRGGPEPTAGWRVLATSGSGTVEWGGRTHELATLAADTELAWTEEPVLTRDGWIELVQPGVIAIRLNPGSRAVLSPPSPDAEQRYGWELPIGELQVLTGPGFAGRQLAVSTPEGRLEVVGTAFAVFRDDGVTCVCVLEGVARIGTHPEDLEDVTPGLRKVMYAADRAPEVLDILPEHRAGLEEFLDDVRAVVETR